MEIRSGRPKITGGMSQFLPRRQLFLCDDSVPGRIPADDERANRRRMCHGRRKLPQKLSIRVAPTTVSAGWLWEMRLAIVARVRSGLLMTQGAVFGDYFRMADITEVIRRRFQQRCLEPLSRLAPRKKGRKILSRLPESMLDARYTSRYTKAVPMMYFQ
jgi:hypothetical protein